MYTPRGHGVRFTGFKLHLMDKEGLRTGYMRIPEEKKRGFSYNRLSAVPID